MIPMSEQLKLAQIEYITEMFCSIQLVLSMWHVQSCIFLFITYFW